MDSWAWDQTRESKTVTQVRLVSESLRKASKLPYDMGAHEHLVKLDDDVHVKKALNGNPFTTKAIQVISKFTT
jgi:hypothetical protein